VERLPGDHLVWLPMDGPLVADLRAAGAEVEIRELPVLRRAGLTPRGLARLARAARALRLPDVDVVHANTSVVLGATGKGPRSLVHVREIYPAAARPLLRAATRRADAIVCVSNAVATQFRGPRVHVVHDGLPAVAAKLPRDAARSGLELPDDAFIAAVVGRISAWKGQELLARALLEVPGAIGLVAGDPWPGAEHHERALRQAAAPLGERFQLLGFRDDVETVYGATDVVVVPSTRPDPLPNAALEAAAAGCCVVAADHGGLPEIVRDGETGRLFAAGDAGALAAVLRELQGDPEQVARLGAAAARDVPARFAPDACAQAIAALHDGE
jgi:glycosyltransferase involved in cell wall biosynthesis